MKKLVSLLLVFTLAFLALPALAEITVTDMGGTSITLDAPLTRLVVLQPADCEILYALGALSTVVGRGTYCDYPDAIYDIPMVASGSDTNIEEILALEPQAVIMTFMSQSVEQVQALQEAGVQVIQTNASDIEGVYTAIELLGAVVGKDVEAAALVESMQETFASVAASASESGKTVYFEISPLAYGLWTAGSGTFMDELASMCGLTNIFADLDGWQSVSEEQVIALNPDFIITTTNYYVNDVEPVEEICTRAGWSDISAIANGSVYIADSNEITRPGPRLADAAVALLDLVLNAD